MSTKTSSISKPTQRSILSLYKALIALRKELPQLVTGDYEPIAAQGDLLLYRRAGEGGAVIVALNLGAEPVSITSSSIGFGGEILLSTFLDRQGERIEGALDLRGNEGVDPRTEPRSGRMTGFARLASVSMSLRFSR